MKIKCHNLGTCIFKSSPIFENCYNCKYVEFDETHLETVQLEALHDDKIINDAQLPITNPDANSIKIMIGDTFKNKKEQINDSEKAARFNEGKPQWSLVHFKSLEPMIRVLEFGTLKYAPRNWQKSMPLDKILESMQRHLAALFDGEEVDSESGISHMGHIQANAMFYNYHKEKGNGLK